MRQIETGQRWLKADLSGKGVFIIAVEQWLDITVVIYHTDDHKMKARDEASFRQKYAPKNPVLSVAEMIGDNWPVSFEVEEFEG